MGKIHIIDFFLHVTLVWRLMFMLIKIWGWTEVNGMEPYELFSDVLPILIELLLHVSTTLVKLFIILTCIITTCVDLFIEILLAPVIYVIQFSSDLLQMLVQELQDLFTLAEAILIMMQKTISDQYCSKGYSSLCKHSSH